MFEITADDIALLNDENLRALVARLCEAEVRRRGFSASCVTWGGSQNAADGGIDVRVALPPGSIIDGFVPRNQDAPHELRAYGEKVCAVLPGNMWSVNQSLVRLVDQG